MISKPNSAPEPTIRVVLLGRRYAPLDEQVSQLLETELTTCGFQVFSDKYLPVSIVWAQDVEARLKAADVVIPILSAGAAQSEWIAHELEMVHETAQRQKGRPRLLPVRVKFDGPLPDTLARILNRERHCTWMGPEDDQRLASELIEALNAPPEPAAAPAQAVQGTPTTPDAAAGAQPEKPLPVPERLEPVYGAVPLGSEFYLARPQDAELRTAIVNQDSIVLIKGARQMGKTSLLARGIQQARQRGSKVVLTDFQKLNVSDLDSVAHLYLALSQSLAEQLDLPVRPQDAWDERRGANVNFERFLRREVLAKLDAPLMWGLDEVDRLFTCEFGSEVFGLFRSWHNERALDPQGPWARLTVAIVYATEAHLFITDMNQSPFNVGTRLALDDFTPDQVAELNRRYRSPLRNPAEVQRLIKLVGGHPFLVRRALHELATQSLEMGALEAQADLDEGIFGDHLRRILVLLARDPLLADVVRSVLAGEPCATPESFYRLRSAGLMSGTSPSDMRPRCQLYAAYLRRHLL